MFGYPQATTNGRNTWLAGRRSRTALRFCPSPLQPTSSAWDIEVTMATEAQRMFRSSRRVAEASKRMVSRLDGCYFVIQRRVVLPCRGSNIIDRLTDSCPAAPIWRNLETAPSLLSMCDEPGYGCSLSGMTAKATIPRPCQQGQGGLRWFYNGSLSYDVPLLRLLRSMSGKVGRYGWYGWYRYRYPAQRTLQPKRVCAITTGSHIWNCINGAAFTPGLLACSTVRIPWPTSSGEPTQVRL